MIVIKFGGSFLAPADSIRRVIAIIRKEAAGLPVIVTSAMGDTLHLDSRKLILTNSDFTHAEPLHWSDTRTWSSWWCWADS